MTSFEEAKELVWRMIDFLTSKQSIHQQNIVVLVPTDFEGWELVKSIERHGIKVNHVFEDENKSHHHKKIFLDGR
ncbi:hypothetical protein [Parathermosynechococcus lividus]